MGRASERASEEYKSAAEAKGLKLPPPLVLVPTELNSKAAQERLAAASCKTRDEAASDSFSANADLEAGGGGGSAGGHNQCVCHGSHKTYSETGSTH